MPGHLKTGRVAFTKKTGTKKIALVVARWNEEITGSLHAAAEYTLLQHGIPKKNIIVQLVPGSFELSLAAQHFALRKDVAAVICLGCVVQGETPHFTFICQAVAYGLTEVALKTNKPVVFGVLTTLNKQQALDRSGGKYGNKGEEAALTALEMLRL
jgi:6,7-dimethyl-8-ribityllumazine synthase